jgi:hypothetical protein
MRTIAFESIASGDEEADHHLAMPHIRRTAGKWST